MSGSLTTAVPQPAFGDQGFVAPAESAILSGRLADINAAFGGNLSVINADGTPKLNTPQGQLASSDAALLGDVNSLFCALANGVDPAYASGRMQDAIARIYFLERIPASSTVVDVVCSGAAGTAISTGSLIVSSVDGTQYACTGGGIIPATGTISLAFACTSTGPLACPAQAFTIYRTVPEWDSAVAPAAGTAGTNVEGRAAFEARRRASVAINAQNSVESIRGAVLAVPGVLDAFVIDNVLSVPKVIGGYTLAPHSVYCAVVGGDAAAVADAIWSKKSLGCDYNGNTVVTVQDTATGLTPPPSYDVSFEISTQTSISVAVTIASSSLVPADALLQIRAAIVAAFFGLDGGQRSRIGGAIYASRFYAPIASLGAWAQIVGVQVGTGGAATQLSVTLPIDQAPTISAANVSMNFA